ncbi:Rieske Fe-S protein [Streptomyces griseochromogenes]|uniref:Cytochrome bc1 complex Rieske iron-sulfur subunit n=1 Tax=Streptomyces griseochromogenes TaxID=68214 RepID=A0A1B1B5U7_9ACTN|nr:Rieske (2Fe-2S) protein [Streptomyces griseochromogenes]ANP54184.1 iron-sulfur protein [Streptomyces griseochromogenes]MBP2052496.1 Rieske Fe-S protein [Streptomyces griseochromogenes]
MSQCSTRRNVLATGAAAFAAVGCVGCGGTKTKSPSSPSGSASPSSPSGSPSPSSSGGSASPRSPGGKALGNTSDIPVGGGKVFKEQKVVVTQPTAGDFKAFSAICTHMGCEVNRVADGTIDCPCHGSKYHVADGSVAHGPATRPLPAETIKVEGNSIRLV